MCAVCGSHRIAATPLVWPDHVCTHFLGMKQEECLQDKLCNMEKKLLHFFTLKIKMNKEKETSC